MKKLALVFSFIVLAVVLFSCKSSHKCAAYSKVEISKSNSPS